MLQLLLIWIGLAGAAIFSAWQSRNVHIEERKLALQDMVEEAVSIVRGYEKQVAAGGLTMARAQHDALARIMDIRYGADGYLFVMNSSAVVIGHPIKPELEHKSLAGFRDQKGNYVFRDLAAIAAKGNSGYYRYVWPKIGASQAVPKLAFVKNEPAWDWTIGTGVYIDDIDAAFRANLLRSLLVLGCVGIAVTIPGLMLLRRVMREVGGEPTHALAFVRRIATGDLTTRLRTPDPNSLLGAISEMSSRLAKMIRGILESTDSIGIATREIADGNIDMSQRTEQQAEASKQTATTIEELRDISSRNADNALQVTTLAEQAARIARSGSDTVTEVVQMMGSIQNGSRQIAEIIAVIEGIAVQTNLLALNAAVEAGRAGEQGKGFSVVATEVRALAQRSANAAKDIKALIQSSVLRIDSGVEKVTQAGTTMDEIVTTVVHVSDLMNQISGAATEERDRIDRLLRSAVEMDNIMVQNAALVEQASAATQSLDEQANQLRALAYQFVV